MTILEAINYFEEHEDVGNAEQNEAVALAIKALREMRPNAEWEEVWLENEYCAGEVRYRCTQCGYQTNYGKPHYCMACGANMWKHNSEVCE